MGWNIDTTHPSTIKDQSDVDHKKIYENVLGQSIATTDIFRAGKFIVYECSKARKRVCGGWSDRISGILSTFVISLLTKRRLLIKHDEPCPLEDYLIPAQHFDWIYNETMLVNHTNSYHNFIDRSSENFRQYMNGTRDINSYFKQDVSFVQINWDFTEEFRSRSHIGREIGWLTKLHYADMYKQLFTLLFQPSPLLRDALNKQNLNHRRPKIACAHVRIGRNPNMPSDHPRANPSLEVLWKYFDKLNKDEYDFFIASDADHVKDVAKKRYSANIIDTAGKITHIDQPNKNDPRAGFLKALLDFYTLVSCDSLIIPNSGFSILAAYLRESDSELYCLRAGDLKPCSRYTIHNIFPTPILAPAP
ncbi:uncharacterized protein LOC132547219 [Ylistrum balloti]|uniref:uncharacterized protein LOC132547219 n=1 Tax=Ylistrum balloti TaxID=509963 RepID=UPI002905B8CF|nr:uncharacterized protein LOC132547219 [Ylistrum balloti]